MKDNDFKAMEKMLQENMELSGKNKRITAIGSISVVLIIIIFGLVIYNKFTNFDVDGLQRNLSARAPVVLKPQMTLLSNDMVKILYPQLRKQITDRVQKETPQIREEVSSQVKLLGNELEASMQERLTAEISNEVENTLRNELKSFDLNDEQRSNIDAFVGNTLQHILTSIKPIILNNLENVVDNFSWVEDSMATLERSEMAQELMPADREEAILGLVRSSLELLTLKLDDPEAKKFLNIRLGTGGN